MESLTNQAMPRITSNDPKIGVQTAVREVTVPEVIEAKPMMNSIPDTRQDNRLLEQTPPQTRSHSPARILVPRPHAKYVQKSFERYETLRNGLKVCLNGKRLDIPDVVAIAKTHTHAELDEDKEVTDAIKASVDVLARHLEKGEMVYGVNTGFGGSADVRTNSLRLLQKGLVQHQNSAILSTHDIVGVSLLHGAASDVQSKAMPTTWVRGLMLTRLNSVIRGHSAVSLPIINTILAFLKYEITPIIPKRGSISASGDLIPLSYLAGALQGNPDIYCQIKSEIDGFRIISSDEALRLIDMPPVVLGAKEGLGLLNGTAASASVASLALYESNHLMLLSQILTAMGVEAMRGSAESFHPFIANTRPHKGQIEVAANILDCLSGSRLAQGVDDTKEVDHEGLAQDRYALRTASQWIGPQVEDLLLANEQVSVELNSTTDNPLIDVESNHIRHGGNFQAASVTSAMEKTRLGLNMVAKLLFAQTTEIMNPVMNRGLPPNLCADDPSVSFMGKGIDITMAAYYSEIAFLSNPVSTHVQSAEMHNQSVNSLALVSGRYTLEVVEILNMMCASYLFMICQALDLRVLQQRFFVAAHPRCVKMTRTMIEELSSKAVESETICKAVWGSLAKEWDATTTLDLTQRAQKTAEVAAAVLMRELSKCSTLMCTVNELFESVSAWTITLAESIRSLYGSEREEMFERHTEITPGYLGQGSVEMYGFVRKELGIPFHRGLADDPTYMLHDGARASVPQTQRRTIGGQISKICEAVNSGAIHRPLLVAMRKSWS